MKTISRNFLTGLMLMVCTVLSAQVNLLDTDAEDYSFERTTVNKMWPPYGGVWGGSNVIGIGKFGASATAIRVTDVGHPTPRTGTSYLFLRMRDLEPTSSLDWLWRKIAGLQSGETYTFSFWYKTPANTETFVQTGNIQLAVVLNEIDVPTLSSPLNGVVTFAPLDSVSPTNRSSVVEHKRVSYTFTVPAGRTEVYIALVRNGNQQPYIDDMSLIVGTISSVKKTEADVQLSFYPNPVVSHINFKKVNNNSSISKVAIVDLQGKIVKSFTNVEQQIDVSDLSKGYYLLRYIIGDTAGTYSFIKE